MRKILTIIVLMVAMTAGPYLLAHAADGLPLAYLEWANKIQEGYSPDIFTKIDMTMHNRVEARNQAEQIVTGSYDVTEYTTYGTRLLGALQQYTMDSTREDVAKINQRNQGVSAAKGEFTYLPHSDGKIEYFKDGLPARVVNERVVNEFGAVSIKNTYNMLYNENRLLIGYEADQFDVLGNKTHSICKDLVYEPGAKWYATIDTNAHRNVTSYTTIEVDHAGNQIEIQWTAEKYQGHFLLAFSQRIDTLLNGKTTHEITSFRRFNIQYATGQSNHMTGYEEEGEAAHAEGDGWDQTTYQLTRTNITYNSKGQMTGYHEVRYDRPPTDKEGVAPLDQWVKVTTDATLTYKERDHQFGSDVDHDPSLLTETVITTKTENPDGTTRDDTETTTYTYDKNWKLDGASGKSTFSGVATYYSTKVDDTTYEVFKETNEYKHTESYYYFDPNDSTKKIYVDSSKVEHVHKVYVGSAETSYEILYDEAKVKQVHSTTFEYSTGQAPDLIDPDTDKLCQPWKVEESTVNYTYSLQNNFLRLSQTVESSSSYDPSDKDKAATETITTTYEYDTLGNLKNVGGKGSGGGYKFDDIQHLWLKANDYTVTVTYNQDALKKIGRAIMDTKETKEIEPQQ